MIKRLMPLAGILLLGGAVGAACFHYVVPSVAAEHAANAANASDQPDLDQRYGQPNRLSDKAKSFSITGVWVPKDEYCASGAPIVFKANGRFETEGGAGRWKLDENIIQMNEGGRLDQGELKVVSKTEFTIHWDDGQEGHFRLCEPGQPEPWFPPEQVDDFASDEKVTEDRHLAFLSAKDIAHASKIESGYGTPHFACRVMDGNKTLLLASESFGWVKLGGDNEPTGFGLTDQTSLGKRTYHLSVGTGMPGLGLVIEPLGAWRQVEAQTYVAVRVRTFSKDEEGREDDVINETEGVLQCS